MGRENFVNVSVGEGLTVLASTISLIAKNNKNVCGYSATLNVTNQIGVSFLIHTVDIKSLHIPIKVFKLFPLLM